MVSRGILSCLLLFSINSCASHRPAVVAPMSMKDIYLKSMGDSQEDVSNFVQERLKEQNTFGYVKPFIPVMDAPVVRKVWIPDHKSNDDGDVLVAGHWVYLMVQPSRWFIEEETQRVEMPVIIPTAPSKD